jgi:beta-lactamase superfamily II metal-dependent hydrolase
MNKVDSIKFRMYNTGSVGDCFLLLFQKKNVTTFSMLIDCGAWDAATEDICNCVDDIKKTCGGVIDLLVVTHEHKDHMSGFNQARELFDKIKFKNTWLSWVENENDPIAAILKERYKTKLKELQKSAEASLKKIQRNARSRNVKGAKERLENTKKNIEKTLAAIAFEMGSSSGRRSAKSAQQTISDAMEYVKSKKKPDYKNPGQVIADLPGAEGIKFYILGPPKDEGLDFLKQTLIDEEMYHFALSPDTLKLSAARNVFKIGINLADGVSPFNEKYILDGTEKETFLKEYNSPAYKWRQIEEELDGSELALTGLVSRLVNNTSLAIALEFEETSEFVLLPADAQSGNWTSWHEPAVSDKLKAKGGKSTKEILNNTVFYKVGHHGSHNGTASVHGLDFMKSKKLVAFMPLVQDSIPSQWGGADNFPAKALYDMLIEKTKGRLIRTDEGLVSDSKAVKLRKSLSVADAKTLKENFKHGALYHEYTIGK